MPLDIPIQTVVGVLTSTTLAGPIGIPMQTVVGGITNQFSINASFTTPMQQFVGLGPGIDASIAIPMVAMAGTIVSPLAIDAGFTIPLQLVEGSISHPPTLDASFSIPMQVFPPTLGLSFSARFPLLEALLYATSLTDIAGELPLPQALLEVQTGTLLTFRGAAPLLESAIEAGGPNEFTASFALLQSEIQAVVGVAVEIDAVLPGLEASVEVSVATLVALDGQLLLIQSDISLQRGASLDLNGEMPFMQGALEVITGIGAALQGNAPLVSADITLLTVITGVIEESLPLARSDIAVYTGVAGVIDGQLTQLSADIALYTVATVTIDGRLPLLWASVGTVVGSVAQAMTGQHLKLAMNITNAAVTEHEGLAIVSYAAAGGRIFAAGPGGLYEVVGTKDATLDVNVRITLGMQDFSGAEKKTATDAYVEAASTKPLVFHVATEAGDDYSYPMSDARAALVVHKANLGRGIRQKRLQFAVSGTDVQHIADVVVLVDTLKRRV